MHRIMAKQITLEELEKYLWGAAVDLRGQIDASAYKDYIFPLVFFKRICDVRDEEYERYKEEGGEDYADMMIEESTIKIPEGAHWKDVFNTTENIGQKLVDVFRMNEHANPAKDIDGRMVGGLEGIFGDKSIWTNKNKMPDNIIRNLLNNFNKLTLSLEACPADEMGTGYEYLIGQFADDAGHTAQEFYTNRTVVELMAEILQLKPHESIYDPTCGSGGMLIKSLTYLKEKGEEWRDVKVFGQEINAGTASIARMNLYLHGIHDFSIVNADTLEAPAFIENGRVRQFDVVLANPPYSISTWNREKFAHDKYGRCFLGVPPQGRADYAFIQHILSSLNNTTGRCAILLPHGILARDEEKNIREKLVSTDLIECIIGIGRNLFFNSPMEACILICSKCKPQHRANKIVFIDAKDKVIRKNGESYLNEENIRDIVNAYNSIVSIDGFSEIVDIEKVKQSGNMLSISMYVKKINANQKSNFDACLGEFLSASELAHQSLDELNKLF